MTLEEARALLDPIFIRVKDFPSMAMAFVGKGRLSLTRDTPDGDLYFMSKGFERVSGESSLTFETALKKIREEL